MPPLACALVTAVAARYSNGVVGDAIYISVDLDSLRYHMRGYGLPEAGSNAVLERGLPRFLELFAQLGVRATFFVVAQDAPDNAGVLRRAVAAGHEIGSHSLTHPVPFHLATSDAMEIELTQSRHLLEQVLGERVRGFRAPGMVMPAAVLDGVARAGYEYDSSLLPSPYVAASLLVLRGYHRRRRDWLWPVCRAIFSSRLPHRLRQGLWELPLSVSAVLRLPFFHTPTLLLGGFAAAMIARVEARAGSYLHYAFHGIDLVAQDEVDAVLRGHPGVRLNLEEKTRLVERTLRALLRRRESRRLDELTSTLR